MKLFGYTCTSCGNHASEVNGCPTDDGFTIRCPACGAIDRVRRSAPERAEVNV